MYVQRRVRLISSSQESLIRVAVSSECAGVARKSYRGAVKSRLCVCVCAKGIRRARITNAFLSIP